jgi:hypothetical protein
MRLTAWLRLILERIDRRDDAMAIYIFALLTPLWALLLWEAWALFRWALANQ